MEKPPILIASASLDEHAYGPVSSILDSKGYPVIIYKTDEVISNEDRFFLNIDQDAQLSITYNGTQISPDEVGAAWYRKLTAFDQSSIQDRAKQLYINSELNHLHDTIWTLYPDEIWMNSPTKIRHADQKLLQLLVAHEVSLAVPKTVVSSDWDDVNSSLLTTDNDTIIVKAIRGIISDKEKLKALYTTTLDSEQIGQMKAHVSPFPGMYQPFLDKHCEWRVTVVGENIFPAAIYTAEDAKVDWRTKQTTDSVEFKHEEIPDDIADKCLQYLGRMGLKFGAFDFIETPDGEMVFLECNPNGQYGWLEEELGFPISDAIAGELINVAKNR